MPPSESLSSSRPGPVERFALRATALAERWMPDAFVFALLATGLSFLLAFWVDPAMRAHPPDLVKAWGDGFWKLIPFTLQMAMIIISGYVLATAPPVYRLLTRLASWPTTPKGAVLLVALAAMVTSWFNWGFSLIFSAVLAKEVARRVPTADYRALAASSFLGLGTVWAQGLSGSAALQMASADSMPKALADLVEKPIPLTDTIFLWQSLLCVAIEIVVVAGVVWAYAPTGARARSAASLGIDLGPVEPPPLPPPQVPGEKLEHSSLLLLPVVCLGFVYLYQHFSARAEGGIASVLSGIDFNTINLAFLMLGALLHRTPASLMRAVKDATPSVWGILLQFPFYAGIFGIMTGSALSQAIAQLFVQASSPTTYPAMIALYSAVLGMFVPSGGSKWVIEAPYVLGAAQTLGVDAGWMVVTYDLGEAVANLLQPFWMLPILALLGLRARDIMGYTFLVAAVVLPLVLILVSVLQP